MSLKKPTIEQVIYSNTIMLSPILHCLRDQLINTHFDDLQLLSAFDKARISLTTAINRMEMIIDDDR